MDTDAQGDPIPVHEQSHLHDRQWSVFFAFPEFAKAVLVLLLDFKEEIGAVIVKDTGMTLSVYEAIFVKLLLDKV